ncbi:TrkA C-terminal domain-containing protein [Synechococcus sp. CS-1328]|uniref:TrkA C-terminal domain-containing protein n=1 Tax=Synechococcus sp. CS-1328 TaxID=2847976 RepID=UPI00223B8F79|nr:TrkA C-terminal domain-containing protein [Synechococcus sp. CS-1328]MCT0224824.1 TrkA C-terminal domain-containing protein [Synechococcus sp. CS-1328]
MTVEPSQGPVLVCGLGSLGQTCLLRLLDFGVPLWGVDLVPPVWEHPDLENVLAGRLVLGDMRSPRNLSRAAVSAARAVLLVSSRSSVNFEAALQVRLLNPTTHIVVRSSTPQTSLGALMERRLPGIAVVDPLLLTASAVAQALGPSDQEATFLADGQMFEVYHSEASRHEESHAIDSRHIRAVQLPPESRWVQPPAGLTLMAPMGFRKARTSGQNSSFQPFPLRRSIAQPGTFSRHQIHALLRSLGSSLSRIVAWCKQRPPLTAISAAVLTVLLLLGVASFSGREGWKQGLFVTLALLKGEYVDPVNLVLQQDSIASVDEKLIAFTLLYSLIGTLLTSALVAVILDRLLQERLGMASPRRLRRGSSQILLVDGGALATEVAVYLKRERFSVIRVETENETLRRCEKGAVVFSQLETALTRLRRCRLEAVALLSEDLLANLQAALSLEESHPEAQLVILAHAVGAAEQLGELLGGITIVSIMDVAADAVVATAFGERVEGVLRINSSNLLLVRYRVEEEDTLNGRSVSRIANGYGVNIITLCQSHGENSSAFPVPETTIMVGDQMVVLADLAALRRVELGLAVPPGCRLRLQCNLPAEAHFEVRQCLARFLGLPPGATAAWLDGREHVTDPIDEVLAQRLRDRLRRLGVNCLIETMGCDSTA